MFNYRAADWKLEEPDWTGRMRIVSKGKDLFIKLEDKTSGVNRSLLMKYCIPINFHSC